MKKLKWYLLLGGASFLLVGYIILSIGGTNSPTLESEEELTSQEDILVKDEEEKDQMESDNQEGQTLKIPELLEDQNPEAGKAEFNLKVQYGKTSFLEGYEADTLGYNGDYLGPLIRVRRGDEVKIHVDNQLDQETTVHWHGLEVDAEMDGGPHQIIEAQGEWKPHFTIDQPAATLWYHPHVMGTTGEQVYQGLAGLFYIEDEESDRLDLPKDYGENDIPLIVQDKRFSADGQIPYDLSMADRMEGFMGDEVVINGTLNPQVNVKNELIRFRILNGSNARSYDFNFDDGQEFHQIASDGGFLEESVGMANLELAAAERAEILVDLSDYEVGDTLTLRDADYPLMTIQVSEESEKTSEIPKDLALIEKYDLADVQARREFVMSGAGPMVAINGKQMDMNYIDERVNLGELEEWTVRNDGMAEGERLNRRGRGPMGGMGMMGGMHSTPHPFHVHGTQFQIIERNGETPPANEQGWKDTVMVKEDEEVRLLAKFNKEGLFMYHCHILEHEDLGMMGQFLVE